ncbi:amino acid adenylation domain-containing protein [Pseudoalteromonas piscicida]
MDSIETLLKRLSQNGIKLSVENETLKVSSNNKVSASLVQEIKDNKAAIIEYYSRHFAPSNGVKRLPRRADAMYNLSPAQGRLWFEEQIGDGALDNVIEFSYEVDEQFSLELASKCFSTIIQRHEVLRSNYVHTADGPKTLIRDTFDFKVDCEEVMYEDEHFDKSLNDLRRDKFKHPFNLEHDLMLRALLVKGKSKKQGTVKQVLVIQVHHIAFDGSSIGLLYDEFNALYLANGAPSVLPPLKIQYVDYADHLAHNKVAGYQEKLDFWLDMLSDIPAVHDLRLDYSRPEVKSSKTQSESFVLDDAVSAQVYAFCKQHSVTPLMFLHAVMVLSLGMYSESKDIVIGIPSSNRNDVNLERLLGYFINTLVLRVKVEDLDEAFVSLLSKVSALHAKSQASQEISLDIILENMSITRSQAFSPVYQIMLNVDVDTTDAEPDSPSVLKESWDTEDTESAVDLNFVFSLGDDIELDLIYDPSLFMTESITKFALAMNEIIHRIVDAPNATLRELLTISEVEQATYMNAVDSQPTFVLNAEVELNKIITDAFVNGAQSVAVIDEQQQYTYQDLQEKSHQIAASLVQQGVVAGDRVVIVCRYSFESIAAILGTLLVGGTYVPIASSLPQERIQYIISDSDARVVVINERETEFDADLLPEQVKVVPVSAQVAASNHKFVAVKRHLNSAPYIIYTSGSTGLPKGVKVTDSNLINLCNGFIDLHDFTDSTVLMIPPLFFDASVGNVFPILLTGNTLAMYPNPAELTLSTLNQYCLDNQVTHLDAPVSMLKNWIREMALSPGDYLDPVVAVSFGGEAIDVETLHNFNELTHHRIALFNHYGPTETTVCATVEQFDQTKNYSEGKLAMGRPLPGNRVYIMNDRQELVPHGCAGEIYIAGELVSCGYVNNPDMSAEKFVADPFSNGRMYKTGDLGYFHHGEFYYIGRNDNQVKIRGFRIELGEIESAILAQDEIKDCLVLPRQLSDGADAQLVAYLLIGKTQTLDIQSLRQRLVARLPDYMVPQFFVDLNEWPLTSNGKIDHKALPNPSSAILMQDYEAPKSETEHQLVAIWAELLGLQAEQVSTSANFFALGGHSLMVIKLVSEIQRSMSVDLPIKSAYDSEHLAAMASFIERSQRAEALIPLVAQTKDALAIPLSFAQQRLWFVDRLEGDSAHYNMPESWPVDGTFDVAAAETALLRVIERHEVLRTTYIDTEAGTVQRITPFCDVNFVIKVYDLAQLDEQQKATQLNSIIDDESSTPFNLEQDLMLRAAYIKLSAEEAVMQLTVHHIASDGWSIPILTEEFEQQYDAIVAGQPSPYAPLPLQYADYAIWQRAWLASDAIRAQEVYWEAQLAGLPLVHSLPLDYVRPLHKSYVGAEFTWALPNELSQQLKAIAQTHNMTMFMLLHGIFSLLISRHSSQSDVAIGVPVANRMQVELAPLIGFFVNTLVLRADCKAQSIDAFLAHIRTLHLDAQANQSVPFERVTELCNVQRSTQYNPLFQIMFDMVSDEQSQGSDEQEALGEVCVSAVKFDLELLAQWHDGHLEFNWVFDTNLFKTDTIQRLHGHFVKLLESLVCDEYQYVSQLTMLSESELTELHSYLTPASHVQSSSVCLHELVARQAAVTPDNQAIMYQGQQISYQLLEAKANQVAQYLRDYHDVKPEHVVGLYASRGIELIVGMLGILKAGAAFAPIDPNYPQERIDYILSDTKASVVLCTGELNTTDITSMSEHCSAIHIDDAKITSLPSVTVHSEVQPTHLAYVIYTSGSTGQPKGVMVEHKAIVSHIQNIVRSFHDDVRNVLQLNSFVFDAFLEHTFAGLSNGACVHFPDDGPLDLSQLITTVDGYQIELMDMPVALFKVLLSSDSEYLHGSALSSLRQVVVGGEALPAKSVEHWYQSPIAQSCKLINAYGPTETVITATAHTVIQADKHNVSIGSAIGERGIIVADEHLNLVPKGSIGELYITGVSIARGYLNKPDLTAKSFIENPYREIDGQKCNSHLYKTGDLVRMRSDGNLEFIGRVDNQVKVRGYRIELSEIEAMLLEHVDVKDCQVLIQKSDHDDENQLVAYVVNESEAAFSIEALYTYLVANLPSYMVPNSYAEVQQWPLTATGKIDHKSLPSPITYTKQGEYEAPNGAVQMQLLEIWCALLAMPSDTVSINDSFFEAGGHSLLVLKLVDRIDHEIGVKLTVKDIYNNVTIKALSHMIDGELTVASEQFTEEGWL